jgi:hypothetical protein
VPKAILNRLLSYCLCELNDILMYTEYGTVKNTFELQQRFLIAGGSSSEGLCIKIIPKTVVH